MSIRSGTRGLSIAFAVVILPAGCDHRTTDGDGHPPPVEDGAPAATECSSGNLNVEVIALCSDSGLATPDASDGGDGTYSATDGIPPEEAGSAADGGGDGSPSGLADVQLDIGGMTFNEGANTGFSTTIAVRWRTTDVIVSSSGHFAATIFTSSGGPVQVAEQVRDVLFWQASADYTLAATGDSVTESLSDVAGVIGSSSNGQYVFVIDTSFRVPPLADAQGNSLRNVHMNMTWVRIYRTDGSLTFSVFPGGDGSWWPPIPLAWNQSASVQGDFAYYAPIPGGQSTNARYGVFDYQAWISANVTW